MNQQWYEKSFRRNLVDMHIEDWDERFLSQFSPEDYVENLKRAKIKSAMLYFHSHVGYSYYPTKSGKMHRGLVGREDAMRRLADLCHENGMDVIGYYSLIFNTYEEDRHPEWRIMDGEEDDSSKRQRGSRYGHCCPNNPEYREYVKTQMREIADYFTVEGMFYDMTYWSGVCHCPHCTKRFFEETGYFEIPRKENWEDPVWRTFIQKRYEWIGEFARFVTAYSKEVMPHASVQHNCAYASTGVWKQACTEGVTDACDFCGGDLYGSIYAHSFAAKYYRAVTQNAPFEYMISRCNPGLAQHTVNRTHAEMELQTFLTIAHHGAPFIIDAMDPVGTMDSRVYEQIGSVFSKTIPYEPYLTGKPMEDVAVYYSTTGRYDRFGQGFDHRSAVIGLSQTLASCHVPYGILTNSVMERCKDYKMIFAPMIAGLGDAQRAALCSYVKEGGTLYFSGAEEPALLRELIGGELMGYTDTIHTYLAPLPAYEDFMSGFNEKYPMTFKVMLPLVKLTGAATTVAARLCLPYSKADDPKAFSSIHSNPPGELTNHPTLVFANYGKGKVIWCAAPVELDRRKQYTDMMRRILELGAPEKEWSLTCDARRQVELLGFETENGYYVNFVDLLFDDERVTTRPFTVKLRIPAGREVASVNLLPTGAPLDFSVRDGELTFRTPETELIAMFEIKQK
ncbi:MAG: alpha-L-fucosidase [Clostridia bacterium]|nr:alpha-L-fucosidase [Clostridia bacterium]